MVTEFSETTEDILVTVRPVYLANESKPEEAHYIWAYHVRLENKGHGSVQLINRHWKITDALGCMQEVEGPGVVGEQPVLHPGEIFEYASGTHLPTPSGIMEGTYEMQRLDKEQDKDIFFFVRIPAFSLDSPEQMNRPN